MDSFSLLSLFYWKDWTFSRTDQFFDSTDNGLWEASWSCPFWMTQRYVQVFEHLKPQYERALSLIGEGRSRYQNWAERMGEDFAIFWMSGVLRVDDPLLIRFLQDAPPRVQSAGTLWINATLTRENWSDSWPRAKKWWEMALQYRPSPAGDEDLASFLFWLESAPQDLTIREIEPLLLAALGSKRHFLGDRFFDFLESRVTTEPFECAEAIEAIAKNGGLHMGVAHDDRLKLLFEKCFSAGNAEAQDTLVNAKRILLSAGLFTYETVLAGN